MTDAAEFGLREGETQFALPARPDASLYFIGRCRTPWTRRADCPKAAGLSSEPCALEIDAAFAPGLALLEERAWIWALYWMDRSPRDVATQRPRHGEDRRFRGVFALRSPARPNPIALSALPLLALERRADGSALVRTRGLDCLDGTPLIDVKPWSPGDARPLEEPSQR
jgi:tRNA-Thr(GGU) m(6)t(6)A37 methyltransferase TsaA